MITVGGIILGILMCVGSFFLVWKSHKLTEWIGTSYWLEDKLGPGGTNTTVKLFGIGLMLLGILKIAGKV